MFNNGVLQSRQPCYPTGLDKVDSSATRANIDVTRTSWILGMTTDLHLVPPPKARQDCSANPFHTGPTLRDLTKIYHWDKAGTN